MRLFLSSFRLGNQPQKLIDLVRDNKRAAIILNACDFFADNDRQIRLRQESALLQSLGFSTAELDLRHYFNNEHKQRELSALLATYGLVWVRGGNSFILNRAVKASGFGEIIRHLLERDALIYGGYSAGMSVLIPSLRGVELVDDPHIVPAGYNPAIVWEGLGLLPYAVAPHYKSELPESADVDKLVQYYIDNHVLFKVLRDEEVIVVNGKQEEVVA